MIKKPLILIKGVGQPGQPKPPLNQKVPYSFFFIKIFSIGLFDLRPLLVAQVAQLFPTSLSLSLFFSSISPKKNNEKRDI